MIRVGEGQRKRNKAGVAFIKISGRLLRTCIEPKVFGGKENKVQASQNYRDICPHKIPILLMQKFPFRGFASGVTVH